MSLARLVLCGVLLFAAALASATAGASPSDLATPGDAWRSLEQFGPEKGAIAKSAYVGGFLKGMHLGSWFSSWPKEESEQTTPPHVDAHERFSARWQKYAEGVSIEQVVAGMDEFYSDYRNRGIDVASAVWIVLNGIAGTSEEKLQEMTEGFRADAREQQRDAPN